MGMGTAGIFGKFLTGYMQGRESEKNRKEQQISSLLKQAKDFAEIADTTPNAQIRDYAEQQGLKAMTDLEKISNEKAIGVGGIMKLFGMGGKGKGGATAAGIPGAFPMTSEIQIGGETTGPPGAAAPGAPPEPAGLPPGGLPERLMPPPGAQAGLAPPPGKELISQAPGVAALPEAKPMIPSRPTVPLPTLPKPEEYIMNGKKVSRKDWREMRWLSREPGAWQTLISRPRKRRARLRLRIKRNGLNG